MLCGGVGSNDEDSPSDDTEPSVELARSPKTPRRPSPSTAPSSLSDSMVTASREAVSIASLANGSADVIVPSEDGSPACAGKEVGVDASLGCCAGDGPSSSDERIGMTGLDALLVLISRYE